MTSSITERINSGDFLVLDGGTGTHLERLGAPMHGGVWCAAAIGSHPHLVRQVHEDYIAAGADIITTNTYAAGRASLAKSGLEPHFEVWHQTAIELAQDARQRAAAERPIYIAGSIAPYDLWGNEYDADKMRATYQEQAQLHAAGGVDFLSLEMLGTEISHVLLAIESVKSVGLPVWVGVSCLDNLQTGELLMGAREETSPDDDTFLYPYDSFANGIAQLQAAGADVVLNMHSEIRLGVDALGVLKEQFAGPVGIYPNSGHWERPAWSFIASVTPEFYAAEAQKWRAAGAQIIGGCCGVGPDHIAAVRQAIQ